MFVFLSAQQFQKLKSCFLQQVDMENQTKTPAVKKREMQRGDLGLHDASVPSTVQIK